MNFTCITSDHSMIVTTEVHGQNLCEMDNSADQQKIIGSFCSMLLDKLHLEWNLEVNMTLNTHIIFLIIFSQILLLQKCYKIVSFMIYSFYFLIYLKIREFFPIQLKDSCCGFPILSCYVYDISRYSVVICSRLPDVFWDRYT